MYCDLWEMAPPPEVMYVLRYNQTSVDYVKSTLKSANIAKYQYVQVSWRKKQVDLGRTRDPTCNSSLGGKCIAIVSTGILPK